MRKQLKTTDLAYIAMFAAILAVCSWISIPAAVPFTLQSFGVFLAVGLLGGKRGVLVVGTYLLLGIAGVPVFAGMKGGIGVFGESTGGFLLGFLFAALVMWAIECIWGRKKKILLLEMVVGQICCYLLGCYWFYIIYMRQNGAAGLAVILGLSVVPYVIPDILKISLAYVLCCKLRKIYGFWET